MLTQALQVMQQLCEELGEAGEESKSVAINTALRAGAGEAAVDDMLQLAEDVRKVALKFIDLSQSFGNATDRMRTGMDRIESESNRLQQLSAANSELAPSIGALKNKMSLWVERIIVLNDHLKNAEEIIDLSLAPIDEKLSALAGAAVRDQEDDKAGESGLGDERYEDKITDEIPDNDFELETVDSCAFGADSPIAFEVQDPGAEVQDIPGLEKNPERIFSQRDEADGVHDGHPEEQIRVEPAPALDTDAAFEELPTKGEDMQDKPAAEAGLDVDNREQTDADRLDVASENQNHQAPMQRDKGYTAEKLEGQVAFDLTGDPTAGDGDFIGSFDALDETTGLMDESVSAEELSASPGTSDDDAVHEDADEDEKVIDLYSLGAVDIG
jgi:hypothetical protein